MLLLLLALALSGTATVSATHLPRIAPGEQSPELVSFRQSSALVTSSFTGSRAAMPSGQG